MTTAPKQSAEDQRFLLALSLRTSVPLWMHQYRDLDKATLEFIARKCGAVLAEKGDVLLFRAKMMSTAEAFNDVARGLAAACLATNQSLDDVLEKLWPIRAE